MKKRHALWIFLGTIAITVGTLLVFIQSKYFADILKQVAHKYMPVDLGVEGDFTELAVKLVPPGVVIKNPSVTLKEKNPAGLPAGTKLDAQFIDVTFQFFQLLTGAVTINAFAIHGATLKVDLDDAFFAMHEKSLQPKKRSNFSWDSLVRFNFRSVSLVESQLDFRIQRHESAAPVLVRTFAKELTIGRSTVDRMPAYDLAVDLQKTYVEMKSFKHALSQFQASAEISASGAAIRNLGLQDGERNFHVNGMIRGNVLNPKKLDSELSFIMRGPIRSWLEPQLGGRFVKIPSGTEVAGNITVEGKVTGDLLDLEHTAKAKTTVMLEEAKWGDWYAEKATVVGAWDAPVVTLESAQLKIGDGEVKVGKLVFDTTSRKKPLDIHVEMREADFRKLIGPGIRQVFQLHMFLNGSLDAKLTLGDSLGIDGSADLVVRDFSFDNQKYSLKRPFNQLLAVKELELKAKFLVNEQGVFIEHADATLPHSKLKAGGKVDFKAGFDLDIKGNVDLADVGKLSAFEIRGQGPLHWTIKGKKPHVVFAFEAEMADAKYLNLNLGNVKGRVVYNDGNDMLYFENLAAKQGRTEYVANGSLDTGDSDVVNMTVDVPRGTIQDLALTFDNFLKESVPWYPHELAGGLSGVIKVSGKTPLDQLSVEGDMELNNIDYLHEIFHYGRMHAGYRRGAYVAEGIQVKKKSGWIRGNFLYGADDVLKFDLKTDGLTTLDIDRLGGLGIPYRAPISFETAGYGKLGLLKSSTRLTIGDGVIKAYSVPKTELSINTDSGRVRGDFALFNGQLHAKGDVGWERGSPSTIDVAAKRFDFDPILVALNGGMSDDPELDSEISGSARMKFHTGAMSRLSGNVNLDSYLLKRKGYSLSLSKPVHIDIQNGNYEFQDVRLLGDGSTLAANGRVRDGKIDYKIGGSLNLGIFEFFVSEFASLRGAAQIDAQVFGRADAPNLKAVVTTAGSDLRLRSIEQPFEDLKFNVAWNDSTIRVVEMGAKFAGGAVRGQGTADLYLYKVPDMDFKVDLDNPKVKVYPVSYARTSGKLSLKGTELPYKVKGNLTVAESLVTENFSLSEGSRLLRSSKFLPQKRGGSPGDFQLFDMDVDLAAERNIFIKNDLFDAEVKGNLKVINSIQAPRLLGHVDIVHGRLLFKDNFFTIQSGSVRFTNPAALDPEFDMTGQTEMKGYKINLVASGTVSEYKLSFQSQPPLSERDIVSLLTLGVTSSGFQNISRENRDAYSRDELYGLLFSQSGVNKGLEKFGVKGVKVRVDQSSTDAPENAFRARTTTASGESVAPKVVVQTEVTKNLNAAVGSTVGVGESQERDVSLEYQLPFKGLKGWSVLGTYEDQRGSQLKQGRTSVGADLKYKIRFK